jgi:hypothetical protein
MEPPEFRIQYECADFPRLLEKYRDHSGDDPDMETAGKSILAGDFSLSNVVVIANWLSPMFIGRVKSNDPAKIEVALKHAMAAADVRDAVRSLTQLAGIGLKRASAILAAIYPDNYTVMSVNSLNALGSEDSSSAIFYVHYLDFCRSVATKCKISLRNFDRANWQWGSEH